MKMEINRNEGKLKNYMLYNLNTIYGRRIRYNVQQIK